MRKRGRAVPREAALEEADVAKPRVKDGRALRYRGDRAGIRVLVMPVSQLERPALLVSVAEINAVSGAQPPVDADGGIFVKEEAAEGLVAEIHDTGGCGEA